MGEIWITMNKFDLICINILPKQKENTTFASTAHGIFIKYFYIRTQI